MKKLIPAFLAGVFALTGVEVLANNVVKTAEFTDTEVVRNADWSLGLDVVRVQVEGSDDTYKFVPISDLLRSFGHDVTWDSETNTLKIVEASLHRYTEQRELHPIIEPIDMDNINPDEWVDIWLFNSIGGMWSDGIVVGAENPLVIPEDIDTDYWFENYFPYLEDRNIFTSVIGCNAQEIRSIWYTSEFGFANNKFNLQDLIDSGIFSDEEIERALEMLQSERDGYDPWVLTEEEIAEMNLEAVLFLDLFSNEQLEQLLELAKLQMTIE